MDIIEVRFRSAYQKSLPPQPIKLKIPGWAGDNHDHCDGAKPQPFFCPPFCEGSTYGLELLFPFPDTSVTVKDGVTSFEGDYSGEVLVEGIKFPPFESFAPNHYGLSSSLDIVGPPQHIIRIEPHPCYYTDVTWRTPCPVPGHLQTEWWSSIFFIVFKAPPIGQTHYFKKGQPYAQILVLPKKVDYDLGPMDMEEAKARSERAELIANYHGEHCWTDHVGNKFSDKYKVLGRAFSKGNIDEKLQTDNQQK